MSSKTDRWLRGVVYLFATLACFMANAQDYYIDPVHGDDSRIGISPTASWRTLARINNPLSLKYGDTVFLKSGGLWYEDLRVSMVAGQGSAARRVRFTTYGGAEKAIIFAGGVIPKGASGWTKVKSNGEYRIQLCHVGVCSSSTIFAVRGEPTGINTYRRLELGTLGDLKADEYVVSDITEGQRSFYYKPPEGADPSQFEFAYTLRQGVEISVPYVTVENLKVILGGYPWKQANIVASRSADYTLIRNCEAYFGFGYGVALYDVSNSTVDSCVAKYNRGTGLYIQSTLSSSATGNTIRNSESAYNGAMLSDPFVSAGVVDRGGIAIQGSYNTIVGNKIHDNGTSNNLSHLDSAIMATAAQDSEAGKVCCGTIARNYIYNSLREGIRVDGPSWNIQHNIVSRWGRSGEGGTIRNAGIAVVGLGASGKIRVTNNTVFSDDRLPIIGINFGMPSSRDVLRDMAVYNNIVYLPGNDGAIGIRINRLGFSGMMDYNLISGPGKAYAGQFPKGANVHSLSMDPRLTDPKGGDFRPRNDSPARNRGFASGNESDFFGTSRGNWGVDIGAIGG